MQHMAQLSPSVEAAPAVAVEVSNLGHIYAGRDGPVPALSNIDLTVAAGRFVVIVGPSGCGKTSLLMMLAGLRTQTSGTILIDGRPIATPDPSRVGVVFQEASLFPWLTAGENVAFAQQMRGVPRAERAKEAARLLARMGLAGHAGDAVWQLSGGMRQRVGLARALAARPDFLLMDEPLGALDAMTREAMQTLLLEASAESGAGVLLVTHGIDEALALATRIIVLAPHPSRVVARFDTDFAARQLAGEPARAIRRDPLYAAAHEALVDAIYEEVAA